MRVSSPSSNDPNAAAKLERGAKNGETISAPFYSLPDFKGLNLPETKKFTEPRTKLRQ